MSAFSAGSWSDRFIDFVATRLVLPVIVCFIALMAGSGAGTLAYHWLGQGDLLKAYNECLSTTMPRGIDVAEMFCNRIKDRL